MKIGLGQLNTQSEKQANLKTAERLVDELAERGAELVVLPEYFNFIGPESQWREQSEPLQESASLGRMSEKARQHHIYLHSGSIMERDGDRIYNTSVVFNPQGEIIETYRKIHLFDVEAPGGRVYFESEHITPGDRTVVFPIGQVRFGLATCYDLRFPELFRALVDQGAEVILLPAAFTLMTGKDHWELLVRARAVENLCWLVAVDQFGSCPPNHMSFGRSMVVDPWGVVVAQAGDGEVAIVADLDITRMHDLRERFPALQHRRKDLFQYTEDVVP